MVFANNLGEKFLKLHHQMYKCHKTFNHASNLQWWHNEFTKDKKFHLPQNKHDKNKCSKCGKKFLRTDNLKRHFKICKTLAEYSKETMTKLKSNPTKQANTQNKTQQNSK